MQPSKLSMKGAVHKNKGELIVPGIALCAISSYIGESEIAVNAANETLSLVNSNTSEAEAIKLILKQ